MILWNSFEIKLSENISFPSTSLFYLPVFSIFSLIQYITLHSLFHPSDLASASIQPLALPMKTTSYHSVAKSNVHFWVLNTADQTF